MNPNINNNSIPSYVIISNTKCSENSGNGLSIHDFEGYVEIIESSFKFNESNGVSL